MSYLTHQTFFINKLKTIPQECHRLSGNSRWPTPAWKLNILSVATTYTYRDVLATTMTRKLTFALYKLSKIITLNTMTPSMAKTRTGTKHYMTKPIYNFETKITLQLTTRTTQTLKTTHCLGPSLTFGSQILMQ